MKKRLPLSVGTVLQSRYTIVGQLGHGGMGAVYEAKDNRTSATVALKETYADDDYTRNAFEREAKMLANMTHEAFPRVMDYFAEGDGFYLVMELIRGKDLSELLEERNAPFETEQVLEWADQILDALEDLHSQDIVHRDIKPSNLKMTGRGRIKLLDFGIAKGAVGDMPALQSTDGSMGAASLQYAPIEQVLRADENQFQMLCVGCSDKTLEILKRGTDSRSDLYSLAATLYHLLTNTLPVNAPTRALSIWSGLEDKLRPAHEINPRISPAVSMALKRALEVERDYRVASATEFRRLLNRAGTENELETVATAKKKTFPLFNPAEFENPRQQQIKTEIFEIDALPTLSDRDSVVTRFDAGDLESSEAEQTPSTPLRNFFLWIFVGVIGLLFIVGGVWSVMNRSSSIDRSSLFESTPSNSDSVGDSNSSTPLKNSLEIELINIPADSFLMGSDRGLSNEKPVHQVTISEGFLIGKYEVTQEQWRSVMGNNPSFFKDCSTCPVSNVSWNNAKDFTNKLNAKNDGFFYRLPTEAEWEYAARAGTTDEYYGSPDSIAWFKGNSGDNPHPVGQKQPNAFGLYDMSGNAWEWCDDLYGDYSDAAVTNPSGAQTGTSRVIRGGSWDNYALNARSAYRWGKVPSFRHRSIGLRVAARPK